jgi:hypothetical protein
MKLQSSKSASTKKMERRLVALAEAHLKGTLDLDKVLELDPTLKNNPILKAQIRKRIQELVPRLKDN